MTLNGWLQILLFALAVLAVTKPMGLYVLKVYDGSLRWLAPVERAIYRLSGVNPEEDQHWTRYAAGLLAVQRRLDAGHLRRAAAPGAPAR